MRLSPRSPQRYLRGSFEMNRFRAVPVRAMRNGVAHKAWGIAFVRLPICVAIFVRGTHGGGRLSTIWKRRPDGLLRIAFLVPVIMTIGHPRRDGHIAGRWSSGFSAPGPSVVRHTPALPVSRPIGCGHEARCLVRGAFSTSLILELPQAIRRRPRFFFARKARRWQFDAPRFSSAATNRI